MTKQADRSPVTATVEALGDVVQGCFEDRRVETIELFGELAGEQQNQLGRDAWTIGLRAIANAYRQAQEARLAEVGRAMVKDMHDQLKAQLQLQNHIVERELARYFDPKSGEVGARLDAFVADGGALAQCLRGHVGMGGSTLAKTLAETVGAESELLKKLSPTDQDGLVYVMSKHLSEVIDDHKGALLAELDPHAEDGALATLLNTLRGELAELNGDRDEQLDRVVTALDANNEDSLVSKLLHQTGEAQQLLLKAIDPDNPSSPLAAVIKTVEALLKKQQEQTDEALEAFQESQRDLDTLVREAVTRFETRKKAEETSPRGGARFEDEVVAFLERATAGGGYAVRPVGTVSGRNGKVGDALIEFVGDNAFQGCRVAVEAKRDFSYNIPKALDEVQRACENRDASVGIFVMAKSHARAGFPELERYGNHILVTWDAEDENSDAFLRAGVLAALFMVTRRRVGADEGKLEALRDVEKRIINELNRVSKIRKANERISDSSDEIREELRIGERKLELLLERAKETLKALNVELHDEEIERQSPIGLPAKVNGARTARGEDANNG